MAYIYIYKNSKDRINVLVGKEMNNVLRIWICTLQRIPNIPQNNVLINQRHNKLRITFY